MTREELFRHITDLHPMPKILFHLSDSLANSQVTVDQIESLILQDPVLTAKMMHLVNSAFFRPVDRITTPRQAIVRLGFDAIKNLAIQVCVQDILKLSSCISGFASESLLKHSAAVRYCTKIITEYLHIDDQEEVLTTSAILHDIGIIIEEQLFSKDFMDLLTSTVQEVDSLPFLEAEAKIFGFSHAQISSIFCESWQISDIVGAPLQYHHDFTAAPDPLKHTAAILNLADVCILQLHIGFFYPYLEPREDRALEFLKLLPADYVKIRETCRKADLRL